MGMGPTTLAIGSLTLMINFLLISAIMIFSCEQGPTPLTTVAVKNEVRPGMV